MSKTLFRSGEYEGLVISDVVHADPCYILWAYSNLTGTGITEHDYAEARRIVDEWDGGTDPYEDFYFVEQEAKEKGWSSDYD